MGEPINPEAWRWYFNVVGEGRCPIVDTWWQTETGGIMITPLPCANWRMKPGSATLPFFGVQPALITEKGEVLEGETEGLLAIKVRVRVRDRVRARARVRVRVRTLNLSLTLTLTKAAWPSTIREVLGDYERKVQTYFPIPNPNPSPIPNPHPNPNH